MVLILKEENVLVTLRKYITLRTSSIFFFARRYGENIKLVSTTWNHIRITTPPQFTGLLKDKMTNFSLHDTLFFMTFSSVASDWKGRWQKKQLSTYLIKIKVIFNTLFESRMRASIRQKFYIATRSRICYVK